MLLCIDPGHGMSNAKLGVYDPGAVAGGYREADIALAWALTLRYYCRLHSIPTVLTRADDLEDRPIQTRLRVARTAKATHFISIHCNAGPILATGTETFFGDEYANEDTMLADRVQKAVLGALDLRDRGTKPESKSARKQLAVLAPVPEMAQCLVELGFITNPRDRARMLDRDRRIAFAEALIKLLRQ